MMHTQLFIRMNGNLAAHLLAFREQVGLKPAGRLSDDWDQQFGRRELRPREQGWVKLGLWRDEDDDWSVRLIYEKDPLPAEEAEQLRRKVLDAAAAAGMTITQSGTEARIANARARVGTGGRLPDGDLEAMVPAEGMVSGRRLRRERDRDRRHAVIELKKISANPWDYTLYKSLDGIFVLKVMFSEGECKIDIGRYFKLSLPDGGALDGGGMTAEALRDLAEEIRSNYPNSSYPEMEKSAIKLVS